jgi:eukaryotic-like serine/threonine-protein kinase
MSEPHGKLWALVSPYLDEALELDPAQREPWLASLAAINPALAAELRELLALHEANRASGFMERAPLRDEESLAGQQIGPYTLERLLGRGGMGSVWLGRRSDGKFEGRVAIKLLDRRGLGHDAAEQIRHEASVLARLSHPHIARLFDAGVRENGQPYLILEYIEGERIDRYCSARQLPLAAGLRLFLGVLDAVAHAQAQLIVHRDLKPSNVLVTPDGVAKLLDFGVAALQPLHPSHLLPAADGTQALTPGYAAPEQLRGERVSAASDVYALGVLLHVLVTGAHPYGALDATQTALLRATLTDELRPASTRLTAAPERRRVRGDLDAIIARALNRDPAQRYATAAELASDIRRFLGNFPVQARAPTRTYLAQKFAQRHWGGVLSVLLTLLVLIAATVVTTLQTLEARRQRDFARAQLGRAEAINDFNYYVVNNAGQGGRAMTAKGLLARAEHVLERQHLNDANRVALLTSIGWEYEAQDDHASGIRILQQAYLLSREVSDPSARAHAACNLAVALADESPTPRSNALIEEGLRQLPDAGEFALDRAWCLMRAKNVARDAGDAKVSLQRAQEAVAALKEVPFPHDIANLQADEELAAAFYYAGRYREADAAFANGWLRLASLGRDDSVGAVIWLNNWAVALLQLGRPLDAARNLRRAIELEETGAPQQSASPWRLKHYAQSLTDLAKFDEAAEYAERALRVAVRADNSRAASETRLVLARIYSTRHDFARATMALDDAESAMRAVMPAGHFAFGALVAERALIAQRQGDLEGALRYIDEAISIDQRAAARGKAGAQDVPIWLVYRSSIETDAVRLPAAERDARQALSLLQLDARPGDLSSYTGQAYLALARALGKEGRAAEARAAAGSAAEQLRPTVGLDHPDTRAAEELSRGS